MDELTHTQTISKAQPGAKVHRLPRSGNELPPNKQQSSHTQQQSSERPAALRADNRQDQEQALSEGETHQSLDMMLSRLNRYTQDEQRDLEFELMNEGSLTVVRVSDRQTGEFIRQIPEKEVVDLARKLNAKEPLQLFNALV